MYGRYNADENPQEANRMIKNVIFDIGNVLMDFRWAEYMHSLFGDDTGTIDAVNGAIWRSGSWASMDAGTPADEAIGAAVRSNPKHEADIRRAFAEAGKAMHRCDYAIPWIRELKGIGKRVFFLSNYSAFSIAANGDVLDFLPDMDGGIFSYKEKMVKPTHRIYRRLCERYGLEPRECLFTDDMPDNIKAAQECGFRAIRFERYEKTYPAIMDAVNEPD